MRKFAVSGTLGLKSGRRQFRIIVEARSERHAIDSVYAKFGATHSLKRSQIEIKECRSE
ncbi:MAG: 50S ribosomal protein L18Ae [Candidatus Anstonellales archaeon]